jgi:hypothetical protein
LQSLVFHTGLSFDNMKYLLRLGLLLFFGGLVVGIHAQERGKFGKNLQIKGKQTPKPHPKPNKSQPGVLPDSSQKQTPYWFNPQKESYSVVEEDTLMIDEGGEPEIVEVKEEIRVDSVWLTAARYYAVWDTRNIDPYKKDPYKFRDTIHIHLYDQEHNWSFPLNRCHVTSPFAYRWYRWHYGTDLALNTGDSVKAAFDGIVRIVRWDGGGYGYYVLLRHLNGIETLYGHLSKQLVEPGQYVKAGQLIGWGGSTGRSSGPHLHYETRFEGDAFNSGYLYDFQNQGKLKGEFFTLTREHFSYVGQFQNRYGYGQAYAGRKGIYHKVRSGETLGHIARKYRTSVNIICRLNGITPRSLLRIGRALRVR